MSVLVTGGTGYIGSHTALELLCAGHEVVLLDNYSNSSPSTLEALRVLAGREIPFVEGDVCDGGLLDGVFAAHGTSAVLHFAALKAAGESVLEPLGYYANNVAGTLCLLERMAAHGIRTLVFSSSAAVYGAASSALTEDAPTRPESPYGRTKLMAEQLLHDLYAADADWRVSVLRYFNAVGAHPSGRLGDNPSGPLRNLLPVVGHVAAAPGECLDVFGGDYPTPDGTCVRDYLHVADIARAHLAALHHLGGRPQLSTHNLGTGLGHSVLEVIGAYERAAGRRIPYRILGRRPGDVAVSRADPSRARKELGWAATYGLDRICADCWRWQRSRSDGDASGNGGPADPRRARRASFSFSR